MEPDLIAMMRQYLEYNPSSGQFVWVKNPHRQKIVGKVAGLLLHSGYVQISFQGKRYQAHRLAMAFLEGSFPPSGIDHINGARNDNRATNLRHASAAENGQNMKRSSKNTSGFVGVHWNNKHKKWYSRICANGNRAFLGAFDSPIDAYKAYLDAKRDMHPFQPVPRQEMERLCEAVN
jgi:hypothetical protein